MSVSSLTKMTTPLPGDQSSGTQGLLMPKLAYRFRVTFENFGISTPRTELTKQVISCDRPKPSFEQIDLHVYNSIIKLPGKPSWDDISVSLRDDATGAVSKLVGEQNQRQFDFLEQSSAASGIDFKFLTRIEILDGGNGAYEPSVLEAWELYGCYINNTEYSGLDYSSSENATIGLTIRFDNAIQLPSTPGIGINVGRPVGDTTTG